MLHRASRRLSALALAMLVAACGGGNDPTPTSETDAPTASSTLTGIAFKGPLHGATVCVYAVQAGDRGAQLTAQASSLPAVVDGCVVTGADGSYVFALPPGTTGELLVEATGGTYCSDETPFDGAACTSGTPVAMGTNKLRTRAPVSPDGTVTAPLTLLTTAAEQASSGQGAEDFAASYRAIATNFGFTGEPSASPAEGSLNTALRKLAMYVGPSTGDLPDIVSGIAAGTLDASNTNFPLGVELAVGGDRTSVHVFTVDASGVKRVSTATLPGIPGTYTRNGSLVKVDMPQHGLRDGLQVTLRFAAGQEGDSATSGTYPVTVSGPDQFTITDTASGTITGGTLYRDAITRLEGTYTVIAAGDGAVTITLPNHGLQLWDEVELDFAPGGPPDTRATVLSVTDGNTFVAAPPIGVTFADVSSGAVTVSVGKYAVSDIAMHPSGKWLYVAAGAWTCAPACGGDTISTFAIDWHRGQLRPLGAIRADSSSVSEPSGLTLNGAGTQMVHLEYDVGMVLWSVDADTGALTREVTNSDAKHGSLVFSPDGSYVYNGAAAFAIGPTTISPTGSLNQWNSNVLGTAIADKVLFVGASALEAWSLTNPAAPTFVDSFSLGVYGVSTRNGSVIVTSGDGGIKSYRFDKGQLSAAAPAAGSAELQRDGLGSLDGDSYFPSVHLNQAGNFAVASYEAGTATWDLTYGYLFAKVGADGQLTHLGTWTDTKAARWAKFIKQPQ